MNINNKRYLMQQALNFLGHHPGSINKHHCYEGGLWEHTTEVIQLAQSVSLNKEINMDILDVSAAFHDTGKVFAYEFKDGIWKKVDSYYRELHIEQSERIFLSCIRTPGLENILDNYEIDSIVHCIRSHHGQKAWGAIEEPETVEAWALHLCDSMSAFCLGGKALTYPIK